MDIEIKRGTYVTLDYYGWSSEVPITQELYSRYYGYIGLVRRVKYVGGVSRPVAEVIFNKTPYIAEVPINLLLSTGACKSGSIPEPGMTFQTCIGAWKCAKYINFVRYTQTSVCYRIATDDTTYYGPFKEETFTYGAPRTIRFFDSPKASQIMPTTLDVNGSIHKGIDTIIDNFKKNNSFYYIDTDMMTKNFAHNIRKDENTMKPAMNPIEKVIFNGPATIVFWKDGTKTVVKYQDVDKADPEKGLAMAIAKHYLCDICGLKRYDGVFKKYLPKETKEK